MVHAIHTDCSSGNDVVEREHYILGSLPQRVVEVSGYAIALLSESFAWMSLLSLTVGASFSIVAPLALTFFCIGGVSFYVARHYVNLSDTSVAKRYEVELENELTDYILQSSYNQGGTLYPFSGDASCFVQSIAERFGWEAIFLYGVPSPELFARIFCFQASIIDGNQLLALYALVTENYYRMQARFGDAVVPMRIPHLSQWKEKVLGECRDLQETPERFVEEVDIEKLRQYDLIDEREKEQLDTFRDEVVEMRRRFHEETAFYTRCYELAIEPHKRALHARLESLNTAFARHDVHRRLRSLRKLASHITPQRYEKRCRPLLRELQDVYETIKKQKANALREYESSIRDAQRDYETSIEAARWAS